MKKYLFALLVITPFLSSGQLKKGDKFIGGTFQISSLTPTNSSQSSTYGYNGFSVYPTMGFLLNEKFAIGGQIGYSYFTSVYNKNQPTQSKSNSQGLGLGFIARRYFNISDKFVFAINGQANYTLGTQTNTVGTIESKSHNYQIGTSFEPCFLFFPSPKWGIEASIGSINYYFSQNLSNKLIQHNFNLNFGTINLGVAYYFRKANE